MSITRLFSFLPVLAVFFAAVPLQAADNSGIEVKEKETKAVAGYVLNNNVWGKDKSPTGWQCITVTKPGHKLSWTVRYDWPVGSDKNSVKCYPSVITGWHWGVWSDDKRLPRQLSSLKSVVSGASAKVSNAGVQNVAYDLWFHTTGTPAEQAKPSDELMIWTQSIGGAGPLGKLSETVEIDGVKWSLYIGDIGWNVFSFIRAENTDSWSINVKAFIDVLVKKGLMPQTKYLTSVQFGTEVFASPGEGALAVQDYFVDLE